MKFDTRPGAGATRLRTSGKSLLSIFLSITFVFPTGIALTAPAAAAARAKDKKPKQDAALKGLPITELSADEAILHALNRLAYGPRPGDVERVRQMGLAKWIEQQLNPNSIDDRGAEARLEQFSTLRMSTAKLLAEYPQPKQQEKQAAAKEARLEQRRADAPAATVVKDISDKGAQAPQEQTLQGGQVPNAENAESMKDDASAASPMKQEPSAEMNAATRGTGKRDLLGGGDPNAVERAARQRRRGGFGRPWPPRVPRQQAKKNVRGLNENYGRELMELHTLGVDGGYTQKDVTEVARCFMGWTIEKPREYADFKFDERLHDPDPKIVLGKKIHAGGMKAGEQVIDLLVHHPSTANFISTKLARRFVSDNPPAALVARIAETFQSSDGDIRAVMHTMIYSPEFWSRDAYRAKIKTPFEFVASTVRALGADVDTPMPVVQWVGRIGEPLYQCQPPTGYADKAETWVNTGALLNRLNFSLALAGNKVRGSRSDVPALLGTESASDWKQEVERARQLFLGGQAGRSTVQSWQKH